MTPEYKGLSEDEAELSRERYGNNGLTEYKGTGFAGKLLESLGDPIIRILLCALAVTLLLPGGGTVFDSLGIAAAVVVSTFVSAVSEFGSEKAFAKMREEAGRVTCTVVRDGVAKEIPSEMIVKGDTVFLKAGNGIPADGYLIGGALTLDLSSLNGESADQIKTASDRPADKPSPGDTSSLFRGATVTAGTGYMLVCEVGDSTYYGRMAREVQTEKGDSPLKEKLTSLARTLSRFGYVCAVCVFVVSLIGAFFLDGNFIFDTASVIGAVFHALTLAVSVVVVAVPEGLPMMITVVLSSNMLRLQKQNVRVRKPVGIETAGSMDILFTDKTGTLTYGTPKAAGYITGDSERAFRSTDLSDTLRFLCGACSVFASGCTVESPLIPSRRRASGGDGTDRAVMDGYLACGEYPKGLTPVVRLPFDSKRKLTAASVRNDRVSGANKRFGDSLTLVKGAPEMLLGRCIGYYGKDGTVLRPDVEKLKRELDAVMGKGMRVVALCTSDATAEAVADMAEVASRNGDPDVAALYSGLTLIAFALVRDELRREAPEAIRSLKTAGIQTVMITGDSRETAKAIASEAGILTEEDGSDAVLESAELARMTDAETARRLPYLRVVARALPQDKSRLVRIARSCGRITAMTGDGINDAPALRAADVGFAMGSGTEVAKEAGDIVIADNNIASIVRAVLYGRTIFRSIRKFVVFQLTMNLCAVGISIIGPFIGFDTPVTVVQMLWINLIMDTLAALAFAGEAPMKRYMEEKPLPKDTRVLDGNMMTRIFVMGVFTVMLCLWYYHSESVRRVFAGDEDSFLCGFFTLFVFSGIAGAFGARTTRLNIFSGLFENPAFTAIMSAVLTAQTWLVYHGGTLFRCVPLPADRLLMIFALSLTVIPAGRILELILRDRIVPVGTKTTPEVVGA